MKSLPSLWLACGVAMACCSCDKKEESAAAEPNPPSAMMLQERVKARSKKAETFDLNGEESKQIKAYLDDYRRLVEIRHQIALEMVGTPIGHTYAGSRLPAEYDSVAVFDVDLEKKRLGLTDHIGRHRLLDNMISAAMRYDDAVGSLGELAETQLKAKALVSDLQTSIARPVASNAGSEEPSDDQKLQAYVSSGISGVPQSVSQEIVRKAKLERYSFSAVRKIEEQATGYLAVQEFKRGSGLMPSAVRNEILAGAEREHPGDWYWMSKEITEQSEAWATLDKWKRSTVPGLTPAQSKAVLAEAMGRYPKDWGMALFVVDSEAKKVGR